MPPARGTRNEEESVSAEALSTAAKHPNRAFGPAPAKEKAAREVLADCVGRELSDPEWSRARTRLVEFGLILRDWRRYSRSKESKIPKAA